MHVDFGWSIKVLVSMMQVVQTYSNISIESKRKFIDW